MKYSNSTWLYSAEQKLKKAGIATARLDAQLLLETVTNKDRSWLLAHPLEVLGDEQIKRLSDLITRRVKHEPLAYIRGKSEFYGHTFVVNNHTLQPRPETETMIELLATTSVQKNIALDETAMLIDIGTGSGCIAISAGLIYPRLQLVATDIDKKCLEIAKKNAEIHHVDISFYHGNLLEPLRTTSFNHPRNNGKEVILANLPYVPARHTINDAAMHEPRHAIFGGKDGLDLYRGLFRQISEYGFKTPLVYTESLPFQHETLQTIAANHGYKLLAKEDLVVVFEFTH